MFRRHPPVVPVGRLLLGQPRSPSARERILRERSRQYASTTASTREPMREGTGSILRDERLSINPEEALECFERGIDSLEVEFSPRECMHATNTFCQAVSASSGMSAERLEQGEQDCSFPAQLQILTHRPQTMVFRYTSSIFLASCCCSDGVRRKTRRLAFACFGLRPSPATCRPQCLFYGYPVPCPASA